MSWSDLIKVLSGVFLAVVLIASGSFLAAQYVIAQFTAPPPRPTFPNDAPAPKAKVIKAAQADTAQPNTTQANAATQANNSAAQPAPSPSPTPSAKPSPKKTDAAGYKGRVVISQGVNLRQDPDRDSERIGGLEYNDDVVVLEDSPDGEWQKVRIESSGQEGWVKSGYVERAN